MNKHKKLECEFLMSEMKMVSTSVKTRQHSSRIRTAHLPTVGVAVTIDVSTVGGGGKILKCDIR